jgi:hypothetical protein
MQGSGVSVYSIGSEGRLPLPHYSANSRRTICRPYHQLGVRRQGNLLHGIDISISQQKNRRQIFRRLFAE